jgi:FtsZ-interacting cell division protein ZipA
MSLQLSLVVLGVVLVAAVVVYNWLQERRYRRRMEQAFTQLERDVLLEVPAHLDLSEDESLAAAPAEGPQPGEPSSDEAAKHPVGAKDGEAAKEPPAEEPAPQEVVDARVVLEADLPFSEVALADLIEALGTLARPARLGGFDPGTATWVTVAQPASGRYRRVRAEMLLADRQGVSTRDDLESLVRAVTTVADRVGARATVPDLESLARRAKELDALCAEVDIAIVLTVQARAGTKLAGPRIRALAEGAGLRLRADGQFHAETPSGATQFTLENQEPEPFFEEGIGGLVTQGVTLVLEVPRVPDGVAAFDRMVETARRFAEALDATVVDDNRQPLTDAGLQAIRQHLAEVSARMSIAGIPAGSAAAIRLFA